MSTVCFPFPLHFVKYESGNIGVISKMFAVARSTIALFILSTVGRNGRLQYFLPVLLYNQPPVHGSFIPSSIFSGPINMNFSNVIVETSPDAGVKQSRASNFFTAKYQVDLNEFTIQVNIFKRFSKPSFSEIM